MKGNNPTFAKMRGKVGSYVVTQVGDTAVVRERNFRNTSSTPKQRRVVASMIDLGMAWRECSASQALAWKRLGAQMTDPHGKRAVKHLSGWQCFVSVCGAQQSASLPMSLDAPVQYVPASVLPPESLDAALIDSAFTLTLTLAAAYPHILVVSAAAPANMGRFYFGRSQFKRLAVLMQPAAAPIDLTAAYTQEFGLPLPNQKIAVLLEPLTAQGFQGMPVTVTAALPPAA